MSRLSHPESHLVSRIGWLRAAVLGANDGIVSTASLIVGIAGLVAGAMSIFARTTATATRPAWRGVPIPPRRKAVPH